MVTPNIYAQPQGSTMQERFKNKFLNDPYGVASKLGGAFAGAPKPNITEQSGGLIRPMYKPSSNTATVQAEPPSSLVPPVADTRLSVPSLFEVSKSTIGIPNIAAPTKIAPLFEQRFDALKPVGTVKPITGLSQDFFERERERRKRSLRDEFFGELGIAQQTASGESAAGRLGSGVGTRVMQEAVAKPYAQEMSNIDDIILQAQAQEAARVEAANQAIEQENLRMANEDQKFRLNTMATLYAQDSNNEIVANQAKANLEMQVNQLANQMALGEAGLLSQEAQADTLAKIDSMYKSEQLMSESLGALYEASKLELPAAAWAPDYFKELASKGVPYEDALMISEIFSDKSGQDQQVFNNSVLDAYGYSNIQVSEDGSKVTTNVQGWNDK